jgi:para-aminobenzoate synthetase component 1
MESASTHIVDPRSLENRLLELSNSRSFFALYTSNSYSNSEKSYELIFGWGAKAVYTDEELLPEHLEYGWKFGFLSYELRTNFESVTQENEGIGDWPKARFFVPEVVGTLHIDGRLEVWSEYAVDEVLNEVLLNANEVDSGTTSLNFQPVESREDYIHNVNALKDHIQRGDIYEVNYCTAFTAEFEKLNSVSLFKKMVEGTLAPFSAFVKMDGYELLCTSPERYIKREGRKLCSQPIKGTNRYCDADNESAKIALVQSEKERAENVMIVDLVRNDLSRVAATGSVKVSELFGTYAFKNVNQLISTVEAELREGATNYDVIAASFPMGSMTGAPKVSAMELAERFEKVAREIYSGSVGYVTPEGDFDFNVVIRSIALNRDKGIATLHVGGAITILSDAQQEYEECLLKAESVLKAAK